jgi:phosphinothricin acetyltransferase
MKIKHCTFDQAPEILDIFNDVIASSTALYDYKPRSMANMESWFSAKQTGGFPVIGAFDDDGAVLGFASFGPFRAWPAYKYSVEHSVYIRADKRSMGIGGSLLASLIGEATRRDYHMMIGGIDSLNQASVRLHEKLGFNRCASIRHAGYKFGRWLDLEFYQLLLSTPGNPVEDR